MSIREELKQAESRNDIARAFLLCGQEITEILAEARAMKRTNDELKLLNDHLREQNAKLGSRLDEWAKRHEALRLKVEALERES